MNLPTKVKLSEEDARKLHFCPACAEPKEIGLAVCWTCFKYAKDFIPLKYSNLEFEEWLNSIREGK